MNQRILIDPGELRHAAHAFHAIGRSLEEAYLRTRTPIPDMPADLRARVHHELGDAARDIAEQIEYVGAEATALQRRAKWTVTADRGGWTSLLSMVDLFGLGGVRALSDRFGQPSRPQLERVLRDYQVAEDEMREWEPNWPMSLLTDPKDLTVTEIGLLNSLSALKQKDFKEIAERSFAESGERYGGTTPYDLNDGQQDAFRHAYWNALMARQFGEPFARKYATAHEGIPGNPGPREAMDMYNNEVGRQIAVDHPDADEQELARLVQAAVQNGHAVVIDRDLNLAYSDQVPLGKHGDANAAQPRGGGQPAEGADSDDARRGTGS